MNSWTFVIPCSIVVCVILILIAVLLWKKTRKRNLWITVYVFCIVFALRLGVTFFGNLEAGDGLTTQDLSVVEKLSDSCLHTLQTFSMDEDYTQYLLEGKRILKSCGAENWGMIYGIFTSVMNLIAPMVGAAVIIDLITGFYPLLKIKLCPRKHKLVFSELNEMSICLAEDIVRENYQKIPDSPKGCEKPMLIFTNVCMDNENEEYTDLLDRAKAIKALCVKKDLSALSFARSQSVTFLLMDEHIKGNLTAFHDLMTSPKKHPVYAPKQKKFQLSIQFKGNVPIHQKDLHKQLEYQARYLDFTQKKRDGVRDIYGKEVTMSDLKKHAVKHSVTYKDNKTFITIDFNFSLRPLDASKPISICVNNLREILPQITGNAEYSILGIPDPPTRVFLFVQDDYQMQAANRIYMNSGEKAYQIVLRVIRDYHNAAINLMTDVPLFMPLLYKPQEARKELHVTILGDGSIAREVFYAVYWCGQIPNVALDVTVLTRQKRRFEDTVSVQCPELFESCRARSDLLRVFPGRKSQTYNPPYIRNLQIHSLHNFRQTDEYPQGVLEKTDYFVIALGYDEMTVEMTDILSKALAKVRFANPSRSKSVIVPAIFNRELADMVTVRQPNENQNESFVIPFALFEQRFCCNNVFCMQYSEQAQKTAEIYNRQKQLDAKNDDYSHWANIVRTIHAPYKLFGFSCLELINGDQTAITEVAEDMYRLVEGKTFDDIPEPQQAWVEHRRWVAYMRAAGFSCPSPETFKHYFKKTEDHKNISLKLHPCLVECSMNGTKPLPASSAFNKRIYDALDFASMMIHIQKQMAKGYTEESCFGSELRTADYKIYDAKDFDSGLKYMFEKRT